MQTAVDGSTATVDQLGILLQNGVSQSEVFDMIYADAVLASSFWVNVALAGSRSSCSCTWAGTWRIHAHASIFVATIVVPAVSLSSYLGLASGLTVSVVEMPGGALAGEEVLSMWGRYLTWTLSTPMILLALQVARGIE